LFAEETNIYATNFWQQILIWNHDPELEVGRIQTQLKLKP
jgi:hypothetical protein